MKSYRMGFMAFIMILLINSSNLNAVQGHPQLKREYNNTVVESLNNDTASFEDEIIQTVIHAHSVALDIYASAFHAEFHNDEKEVWNEVRSQLLNYWSPRIVEGALEELYSEHLWDWGYEMGFAFPLSNMNQIENAQVLSQNNDGALIRFTAQTNYETTEEIYVRLVRENNQWVVDSAIIESELFIASSL